MEPAPAASPRREKDKEPPATPCAVTATATATQPSSHVAPHAHGRPHQPNDIQPRPGAEAGAEAGPRSGSFPATESANNEKTTTTRHFELRDPRPDSSDDPPLELAGSLVERH